ncbi:MAG: hypothetical protein E6Q97_02680 [Desulfurellales bacterium]|nr:MAG: hypothetical protein E6Q97_02680 [Desulfurellales bacterium]
MPLICELDAENCWTGAFDDLAEGEDAPEGWVRTGLPAFFVPEGKRAMWIGGRWELRDPPHLALIEAECSRIDTERDRRQALDFEYDFGAIPAVLDDLTQVEAGVRSLQMAPRNRDDWQGQQARALAAVATGSPDAVILARAADNANLLVPASLWLTVYEAGAQRYENLMRYAAGRKALVRQQTTSAGVVATQADTDANWPA